MTNNPNDTQPDIIMRGGRTFHRITRYLPLSWADPTSHGYVSNEEWLDCEATRVRRHGIQVWIHHDSCTDTGALFANRYFQPNAND